MGGKRERGGGGRGGGREGERERERERGRGEGEREESFNILYANREQLIFHVEEYYTTSLVPRCSLTLANEPASGNETYMTSPP